MDLADDTRLPQLTEIAEIANSGSTALTAVACEKPLARNLAEAAQMVRLIEEADLLHGYLENQVFAPAVRRARSCRGSAPSRPPVGRTSSGRRQEHSGPHEEWFWQAERTGGGAMLDMMCHSVETGRFPPTEPGAERSSLSPAAAQAYVARLRNTRHRPATGGAPGRTRLGSPREPRTTHTASSPLPTPAERRPSWKPAPRGLMSAPGSHVIEIQGPEYSAELSTLRTGLQLFLSRAISTPEGEDMVEKQNAEHGLMPVVEDEAASYGYVAEDRHMVESFLAGRPPEETFHDGMAVVELLMALYKSAETSCRLQLPDATLSSFVPSF